MTMRMIGTAALRTADSIWWIEILSNMVQTRTRRARTSAQVVVKGEEARVFPTSGAGQAELLMGDIRSHSDRGRPRLRDRSKSSAYSRSAGRREPALTRGLGEQLRRPALGDVRISALTAEAAFRRGQFPRGIAGGVRRGNPATRTCAGFAGITTSAHGASLAHR
jgi:hypothetical protein